MNSRIGDRASFSFYFIAIAFIFLLLFVVQPFLTVVLLVVVGLMIGAESPKFIYIIAFFGACYLGLVNATKLPESDYLVYLEWYSNAQEFSLPTFLILNSREPLYYIYLYAIANLPYSSEQFFVFASTVIGYLVFMFGVIRASIFAGLHSRVIISLVVALMFFPPLFSLSAHLMRQFIASSFVMLFFSEAVISGKKHWWILIAAILMHYSAIIFIPLAMIRKIDRVSTGIGLFLYLSLLIIIYLASKSVALFFTDIPVLGFVFDRVAGEEGANLGHLNVASIIFVMLTIVISIWNLIASRRVTNTVVSGHGWGINVAVIILGVIVVAANMQDWTAEIAIRFFFYLYFFLGLVMPMFAASHRKIMMLIFPSTVLLIIYFFYSSQFGTWQYASLFDLLFSPSWGLWHYRA